MKVLYGDVASPMALTEGSVDYGFQATSAATTVTSDNIQRQWFKTYLVHPAELDELAEPGGADPRRSSSISRAPIPNKRRVLEHVREYVRKLGLPAESIDAYPHQLSGGMRQRIMIAMATFFQPQLILADEPTTALDVVVQKEILLLLMDLQEEMKNTIVFVSHDMGVHYQVTHDADHVCGQGRRVRRHRDVFSEPLHPYTLMLINSLPTIGDDRARQGIAGPAAEPVGRARRAAASRPLPAGDRAVPHDRAAA